MNTRRFTRTQDGLLRRHYPRFRAHEISKDELEELIGIDIKAIYNRAGKLNLQRSRQVWTQEENDQLRKAWSRSADNDEIVSLFQDRTPEAIRKQASKLNLALRRMPWTNEEDQLLQEVCKETEEHLRRGFLDHRAKWAVPSSFHGEELQRLRDKRGDQALRERARKLGFSLDRGHKYDRQFFDIPNWCNSYWAGWLAAGAAKIDRTNNVITISVKDGNYRYINIHQFSKQVQSSKIPVQHGNKGIITFKFCAAQQWIESLGKNFGFRESGIVELSIEGINVEVEGIEFPQGSKLEKILEFKLKGIVNHRSAVRAVTFKDDGTSLHPVLVQCFLEGYRGVLFPQFFTKIEPHLSDASAS
ncbi:MAG: hypothetical protein WA902_07650 [Thermosynechococcaceae cyanobacterium]